MTLPRPRPRPQSEPGPEPRPPAFRREIRTALRYERGLALKALLALAVVAVVVIIRTLYFALGVWLNRVMRLRTGLRRRVAVTSGVALVLAVAALAVALVAANSMRTQGNELSDRLVPAAAAAGNLADVYQAQQTWLRGYVTAGKPGPQDPFGDATGQIQAQQAKIGRLVQAYPALTRQLGDAASAYQAWSQSVADLQLAAMERGDAPLAQGLQGDTGYVRPYVLAVRSANSSLGERITGTEEMVTTRLNSAQTTLLIALIVMCVVVVATAADATAVVWLALLRPFRGLRGAIDSVAAGNYETEIPAVGPPELADLGRGVEQMRTRLVVALAERQRAEQRFRRLFDSAPDAMIAVTADGSIAMANARASRTFGYEPGDLIGRPVELLVPEDAREVLAAERAAYFAGPQGRPLDAEFKLSGLRQDGRTFPAEMALSSLPMDSGILVTAAIRDVTERRAMEAERERLRAQAEKERVERRLQQSQRLESLGQLVGGVAHDFNNLLNVIQGYADFTAEEIGPRAASDPSLAPVLDDIEQVRVASQQAARLTRQLLTFARHEVTRPEVLDLNETVHQAGQLLRRTLGEHIALSIEAEPALWPVTADRGQLEQVLVNLAVNARDAMPGGGRLTIDTGNTEVDEVYASGRPTLRPGRYARLRVSDTGSGMDRATAERVFEPFFSTKPKGRGTGLGLATVYGIVTGAGGSIDIYSEPGLGTTVSVLLPVTAAAAAPDVPPPAVAPDDRAGQGETILVVEDEASLRELTSRILTRGGYQVRVAESGSEAISVASDPSQPIDLLLTDVVMPEMLGNEVAAQVQAIRPGVPTLFMSGYAEPILDFQGIPPTPFGILEKPFTETALLARVRKALHRLESQRNR